MRYRLFFPLLVVFVSLAGCAEVERTARATRDMTAAGRDVAGAAGMVTTTEADWRMTASMYHDRIGYQYAYDCPGDGTAGAVWGSGPYSSDSSVCTAGVHAGAITMRGGGRVLIEMRPGQDRYAGSNRNGVSSSNWGSYGSSFRVISE